MHRIVIVALALLLQACANTTNEARERGVILVWNRVEDTQAACQELMGRKEIYAIRGCSKWSDTQARGARVCNVYTRLPKTETDTQAFATLGHEVMHCFEGNWHDRWGRMNPALARPPAQVAGE
jgi:hypothetical protein